MADDDFVIVRIPGAPTLYRVPRRMLEQRCRARGGCRAETVDGKLYCSLHLCQGKDCCSEANDCIDNRVCDDHRCEQKSDGFFYKGKRMPGIECKKPKEPGSLFCAGHKCLHCVLGVSQWNDRVCDDHRCKYRTSQRGWKARNCRRYIGGELPDGQHCASHILEKELHPCECNSCRRDPTVKDANKT